MKSLLIVIAMSLSLASKASNVSIKVVYGEDDRIDVYNSNNPLYIKLANSTAAKVSNSKIKEYNSDQYILGGKTLEEQGICASERFSQQPTVGRCSGFLVADNILVTAGHCARTEDDCTKASWVFDYQVDYADQSEVIIDKTSVYKCKKVVAKAYNESTKLDYAVIELARRTEGRSAFSFRVKTGKNGPFKGTKLAVIGHPSGLPSKISDGGWIRSLGTNFFNANLDTFAGNSGSPVIDRASGMVEGILVRGETDYVTHETKNCKVVNRVPNNYDTGEGVTRITSIKNLSKIIEQSVTSRPRPEPVVVVEPTTPAKPVRKLSWWRRVLRWFSRLV